jgi:hypothetical protein
LAGVWEAGAVDKGTMTLTVTSNGVMGGSYTNSGTSTSGAIQGRVLNDGSFIGAFVENGTGIRIQIQGVMDRMADDGLAGDGTFTRPGETPAGFTFTLPNADD